MKKAIYVLTFIILSCSNADNNNTEFKQNHFSKNYTSHPDTWFQNIDDPEVNKLAYKILQLEKAILATKRNANLDEINDQILNQLDEHINAIKTKYSIEKTKLNKKINILDEKIKKLKSLNALGSSREN